MPAVGVQPAGTSIEINENLENLEKQE